MAMFCDVILHALRLYLQVNAVGVEISGRVLVDNFRYFKGKRGLILILLKLINNSSSSNKGNHNREGGLDTRP